eukprot:CAMPEP_0182838784 /NCGR_PEP_ID=MMETSP0006_2-20121128/23503_1 /TAXON_ID=97485 /ORGANISM="Prymnesium parvum, Strain Texoma1" /LENGTH=55 /DNA_ID=CAMNT_0024967861 /DNA_START=690 /DNA_END=857 /DNA_ORIENTATION=-
MEPKFPLAVDAAKTGSYNLFTTPIPRRRHGSTSRNKLANIRSRVWALGPRLVRAL